MSEPFDPQPPPEPREADPLPARCPQSQCILWEGGRSMGYGTTNVNGVPIRAHRLAWMNVHGDIPEGAVIHHRCHNRLCVNVDHLQLVASKSEHVRMHLKPQKVCGKCGADNFYIRPNGKRWCRTCRQVRERSEKYRAYQRGYVKHRYETDPEYRERKKAEWHRKYLRTKERKETAHGNL